jgi:hypothetical protein
MAYLEGIHAPSEDMVWRTVNPNAFLQIRLWRALGLYALHLPWISFPS